MVDGAEKQAPARGERASGEPRVVDIGTDGCVASA